MPRNKPTAGLDQLGPIMHSKTLQAPQNVRTAQRLHSVRKTKWWDRLTQEQRDVIRARQEKLIGEPRLVRSKQRTILRSVQSARKRKVKPTLPTFNLPPEPEQ